MNHKKLAMVVNPMWTISRNFRFATYVTSGNIVLNKITKLRYSPILYKTNPKISRLINL